jgi:hypothetical protein
MNPIIHEKLHKARIGDLQRRAEQERLARAAILARRTRWERGEGPAGGRAAQVPARRLLIILGARSVWPGRATAWARSRL